MPDTNPTAALGEPLTADPKITCNGSDPNVFDDEPMIECMQMSRFQVSRSDGDESYGTGGGTEEACEQHLADAVSGMVNGDANVRAVVAIRWDGEAKTDAKG